MVVYLAFVVGLGFSFTENIQYGANVYVQATAWGEQGNVTMIRNVLLNPFPGDLVLDPTEHVSRSERLGFAEAEAEQFSSAPKPDERRLGSAAREVLEVVSNTFLNLSGDKDERVVRDDVDAALAAASFLADLEHLAACDAFVGTWEATLSRLAILNLAARAGALPPFIWLDAPNDRRVWGPRRGRLRLP